MHLYHSLTDKDGNLAFISLYTCHCSFSDISSISNISSNADILTILDILTFPDISTISDLSNFSDISTNSPSRHPPAELQKYYFCPVSGFSTKKCLNHVLGDKIAGLFHLR